jgi:hypothetical protein
MMKGRTPNQAKSRAGGPEGKKLGRWGVNYEMDLRAVKITS